LFPLRSLVLIFLVVASPTLAQGQPGQGGLTRQAINLRNIAFYKNQFAAQKTYYADRQTYWVAQLGNLNAIQTAPNRGKKPLTRAEMVLAPNIGPLIAFANQELARVTNQLVAVTWLLNDLNTADAEANSPANSNKVFVVGYYLTPNHKGVHYFRSMPHSP
jgi:hypothetical protein